MKITNVNQDLNFIKSTSPIACTDTPEKYQSMQAVIVPPLLEFLRALSTIEASVYTRSRELDEAKYAAGIPASQVAPGSDALWKTYKERYGEAAKQKCTAKLLGRGFATSFGNPARYAYLDDGCTLDFTMKSAKKAVVTAYYSKGIDCKQQFVLKNTDGDWKLDAVFYGFDKESTWHADHI